MASPLLETKFHVPRRRRGAVDRPRLNERLSRGAESALTLVSAPAGFGKTTLLAEWLAIASNDERSAGWLSLDQRDNDPVLFWTYLITALKTAAPGVGEGALSLLQSPQAPIEAVLATLLNDLAALAHDVVLVLDDFHLVDAPEVRDGIAFLLEHLPPQTHLVISGRADPALPLARLRARGELAEIRAAELLFTPTRSRPTSMTCATEPLAQAQRLGEHNGLPQNPYRWRVVIARIRQAQGMICRASALPPGSRHSGSSSAISSPPSSDAALTGGWPA